MEVKLTPTAAEALNEIILNHLQNENLTSAEKTEQSFYEAFEKLSDPKAQHADLFFENELEADVDIWKAQAGNEYQLFYVADDGGITILNICHTSRMAKATT